MDERQAQEIAAHAYLGAEMKEFMRGPGYAEIERFVTSKVKDGHKAWLAETDPAKRELLWYKTAAYAEFENHLKKLLVQGTLAQAHLDRVAQENLQ